jgi:hypothetical protein
MHVPSISHAGPKVSDRASGSNAREAADINFAAYLSSRAATKRIAL